MIPCKYQDCVAFRAFHHRALLLGCYLDNVNSRFSKNLYFCLHRERRICFRGIPILFLGVFQLFTNNFLHYLHIPELLGNNFK